MDRQREIAYMVGELYLDTGEKEKAVEKLKSDRNSVLRNGNGLLARPNTGGIGETLVFGDIYKM